MRYYKAENAGSSVGFLDAVLAAGSVNAGLYMPDISGIKPIQWTPDFAEFSAQLLFPFMTPDLGRAETLSVVRRAFTFPVQWRELARRRYQLELFHGPTGSFRDFGAQLFTQIIGDVPTEKPRLILHASCGESGSALSSAFAKQRDTQLVLLYPKHAAPIYKVGQGEDTVNHVKEFSLGGSLVDCKKMIAECIESKEIQRQFNAMSMNNTHVIWLLSQMAYYAYSSLLSERLHRQAMNIIIPAGNCAHLTAACLVREMGYPIDEIVATQNANRPLVDYVATGCFRVKPLVNTIMPEMDINNPSSFLRLRSLYPSWEEFADSVQAFSATDEQVKKAILDCYKETGAPLCPRSAAAYSGLPPIESDSRAWTIAAAAHPAKFNHVIEPLIKQDIKALETHFNATSPIEIASGTALHEMIGVPQHP